MHGPIAEPASPTPSMPAGSQPPVLSLEPEQLRRPRSDDGIRAALRVLVTARAHMTTERTAAVNALTALLRVAAPGY